MLEKPSAEEPNNPAEQRERLRIIAEILNAARRRLKDVPTIGYPTPYKAFHAGDGIGTVTRMPQFSFVLHTKPQPHWEGSKDIPLGWIQFAELSEDVDGNKTIRRRNYSLNSFVSSDTAQISFKETHLNPDDLSTQTETEEKILNAQELVALQQEVLPWFEPDAEVWGAR